MLLAGFTSPNSTTLKRAVPFHDEMDMLLGDWSTSGETVLWLGSVVSGILFCKLVRSGPLELVFEISKELSPIVCPGYDELSKTEQLEWNNRSFSTGHAVVASIIAINLLYISDLFRDSAPYGPVVFRSSIFSQFGLGMWILWPHVPFPLILGTLVWKNGKLLRTGMMQFSGGYFLADMGMIALNFPRLGGYEFLIHHTVSLISLALAVHCAHAHVYLYMVLLSECTTPLINLRWHLTVLGLKNSRAYVINGAATTLLWLIARVILFLYFFYHMYNHYNQLKTGEGEVSQLHPAGYYFLLLSPGSLGLMNFYWFFKIIKAMIRTLKKKKVS